MRFFPALMLSVTVVVMLFGGVATDSANAAPATWTGAGLDALWSNTVNWSATPVPGVGDTATFNAAAGAGGATITTGTISLGTLLFDTANAAAYTIGGATAGTGQITFADGITNIITVNSTVAQNQLINANIILGTAASSTSTITNSAAGRTLTIAGSITGGTGGTAAAKTLTLAGAGNITLSGAITKGGATTLTVTDTAAGTLTLSGTSTINQLNLDSVGGSTVDIGSGSLTISGITSGGAGLRSTTGGAINGTGTIAFTQNSATNGTDNGTANGTTLTINPRITGSNCFESFVASGNTGKLVLANSGNDFTGNLLINSGIVEVATIGASGTASAAGKGSSIQVGNGTNTGATLRYTGAGNATNRTLNFAGTTAGPTIDMSGTGTLQFTSTAAIAAGAGVKTVTLTGSTAGIGQIDGILQNNSVSNTTAITKTGTGTWILAGANTYTGATTLTQGNLRFNGLNTGVSAVTVSGTAGNNATLGGTGTVPGTVTLSAGTAFTGAAINPGAVGGAGTLTLSNATGFTANAFSRLNVDLTTVTTVGGGVNDLIASTGVPTISGVTQINVNPLAALSTGAQYTIINGYTGTIAGANFTAGSITGDATHSIAIQNNANSVSVIIGAATPTAAYWSGATDANWNSMAPTTAATNWRTTAADNIDTQALPGSVTDVFFATTTPAAGNLSTALNQTFTIRSLTFDSSVSAATGIAGPGALTIGNAAGITNNSSAGGAVTISAPVTLGTAQTWTNNNATDALVASGVVSGSVSLTKAGAGALTLSGANTFTGGLTLNSASTLNINSATALGTGTFTIAAAGTLDNTSGSAITMTANNLIALNSNFTFGGTNNLNMGTGAVTMNAPRTITTTAGTLTLGGAVAMGANALTKAGPGTLTLSGVISGTTANGSISMTVNDGTLNITGVNNSFSGNIVVDGASSILQVAGSNGSATGGMLGYVVGGTTTAAYKTVTLQNGGIFRATATFNDNVPTTALPANGYVFVMGTGGGVFDVPSGVTLSIDDGSGTGTATTASQLQGSGTLTKTGLGTLNQDDSTAYAGAIVVTAGTLQPSSANAFGATSAGTTIQSGARLNVNGITMTNQEPLTIHGTGLASSPQGALTNASGTAATWTGPITLGSDATIGMSAAGAFTLSSTATVNLGANTLTFLNNGTANLQAQSVISGIGAVVVNGAGQYVPNQQSTYSGGTTFSAGTSAIPQANSTGGPGAVTSGPFGTGVMTFAPTAKIRATTSNDSTINNDVTLSGGIYFSTAATEKNFIFGGPATLAGGNAVVTSDVGTTVAGKAAYFNGAIGDGGNNYSLTKAGTGNLILGGTNTYAGGTVAQAGFLGVTGSLQNNTALSIAAGAGNVATLSFINNAANSPANISTLAIGNATGSTTIGLDLGTASDQLATTAAATAAGPITFHLNAASGFAAGNYNLITAASGLTAGSATYGLGTVPGGYTYAFNNTDNLIQLNATAATAGSLYWSGNLGASWATLAGLTTTNWATDAAGTIVSAATPGAAHTVVFSATGAVGPAVTTTLDNNFTVNDLQFLAAPAGVTAVTINPGVNPGTSGLGTLTIAPSAATAGMTLAQGAGAVTIAAPITLGAPQTWSVDSSTPGSGTASSLTVTGAIGGGSANAVTFTTTAGTTPIILSSTANTYSGPSTVSAGTIVQGGAANSFSPNTAWTVIGTLNTGAFSQATGSLVGGTGIVQNGSATNATLTVGSDNLATATFAGTIQNGSTGTLGITKTGTGTQILSGTNTYTGATVVNNGILRLGSAVASTTATVSGGTLQAGGNLPATTAVTLSGTGTLDLFGASQTIASLTNVAGNTLTNSSTSTSASTATTPGTPSGTGVYVDALTIGTAATSSSIPALITDGPTRKTQIVLNNANLGATFSLTNAGNTFSGGLVLAHNASGTRLDVSTASVVSALGAGPIIVGQSATDKAGIYFPTASLTVPNPIVVNTTLGTDRTGVRVDALGTVLSGTLTANLSDFLLSTNGTGAVSLTGRVTGTNGLALDGSTYGTSLTVTLNNATANPNDYAGDTKVNTGNATRTMTLTLGAADQIPNGAAAGNVVLTQAGTGIANFNLAGFNETINGLSGNGTLTATGSTLTLGDNGATASFSGTITDGTVTKIGSGTQTFSGANTFSTLNVNGGLVAFATSPASSGPLGNTLTVNLDGGGISYTATGTNALNRFINIGTGNGTVDVASSTGTLQVATLNSSGGNLVKTGSGVLELTTSTTLNGGAAGVVVNGGALKGGYGTGGIGSINVGAQGYLSFQNAAAEVLTLGGSGALTLASGAKLGFELGAPTVSDQVVYNTASVTGGSNITLNFFDLGGLANGTYTLLTSSTTGGLTGVNFLLGSAPNGFNYTIANDGTTVTLGAAPFTPIYWNAGNGSLAAAANFSSDPAGTTPAGHAPATNEVLIFSSTAATGPTIAAALDGSRTIEGVQFTNAPTGITSVTIDQGTGGTLTLSPPSASGGLRILTGGGNATINAPLAVGANQTWDVADSTSTLAVSGGVAFNANVNASGSGIVTLGGAGTGTGNVTLNGGTLNINNATALGGGTFTINAGTAIDNTSGGTITMTANNPVNVNGDFTFTGSYALNLGAGAVTLINNPTITTTAGTLTVGGVVGGASGLTKAGAGTLVLGGNNTYSGTTNVDAGALNLLGNNTTSGQTILNGGTLNLGHAAALGTGALVINSGTIDNISGGSMTIANNNPITVNGGFTITGTDDLNLGTGTITFTATPTITTATAGKTLTLANNIGGGFGLTKAGAGTLTLTGTNTYTGNTTATGGTLNISGAASLTGLPGSTKLNVNPAAGNAVVNYTSSGTSTLYAVTGANVADTASAFNQTAGIVYITPGTTTGTQNVVGGNGAYGYLNITGGTLRDTQRFTVSGQGTASATNGTGAGVRTGVVFVGGTGFIDHTNAEWWLNYSLGQITVADSGKIDHTGSSQPFGIFMNHAADVTGGGYGVLNLAGANAQVITGAQPIRFGNSTTANQGAGQSGFVNLAAGTLSVGAAMTTSLPTTPSTPNNIYINFAGGTLRATANVTNWNLATSGTSYNAYTTMYGPIDNSAVSGAPSFVGGLTIDTNGFDLQLRNFVAATGAGVTQADMTVGGGSGYIGAPAVIFSSAGVVAGGSPASGYALISGGQVTGIVITNPGTYTAGTVPTVLLIGGGGSGASVTIGALNTLNTSGGLTKIGAGTATLQGDNNYAGPTAVNEGTLRLGSGTGGGTNASISSSSSITVASGATFAVNRSNAVSQGTDFTANPITGQGGFTQMGDGTTTLTAANAYQGTTTISAGTLQIGNGGTTGTLGSGAVTDNATLAFNRTDTYTLEAGNLVTGTGSVSVLNGTVAAATDGQFNVSGNLTLGTGTASVGTLDLTNGSSTFGSLVVNTNNTAANTVIVGAGKTLTLNGNITLSNNTDTAETRVTMTGGGALVVNGASITVGNNTGGTNISSEAHLNLAGLGSFNATLSGNLTVQASGDNSNADPASMILSNGPNSIAAAAIRVGNSSTGATNTLTLGTGTNVLHTDLVNLGNGGRDTGAINCAGTGGSVTLRNLAGTGRVGNVNLGVQTTQATAYTTANVIDVTGNTADIAIGTLATSLGAKTANNTNDFKFDTGTLDIRSINMAVVKGTGTSVNTITIGGGTVKLGGSVAFGDAGTGTVTLATAGSGELAINGGTVTSTVSLLKGAGGTGTATITLNGGTLDVGGNNIGSAADTVALSAQAGVLKNLAQLNGGGTLTKTGTNTSTLTLDGTNAFTGNVTISNGGIVATNSTSLGAGTKTITVNQGSSGNANLRLDGSGGDISLPATFTYTTSNQTNDGTIINLAGNNTLAGQINMTSGGGATQINVLGGTLNVTANLTAITTGRVLNLQGAGNGTFSGNITHTTGNDFGVSKFDANTWTLSGTNTYTGATTVQDGRLKVTGTVLTGSASVTGTTAVLELAGTGPVTPLGLDVSNAGTLEIATAAQELGDISGTGTTDVKASASLTANSIVQDTLIIGAGGSVTIRETPVVVGGAAGANAVPEPGTWALIGIGLLSLLAFRRRR